MSLSADRSVTLRLLGLQQYVSKSPNFDKDERALKLMSALDSLDSQKNDMENIANKLTQIVCSEKPCNAFDRLISLIVARASFHDSNKIDSYAKIFVYLKDIRSSSGKITLPESLAKAFAYLPDKIINPEIFIRKKLSFLSELVTLNLVDFTVYEDIWKAFIQRYGGSNTYMREFFPCAYEILKSLDETVSICQKPMPLVVALYWEIQTRNLRWRLNKYREGPLPDHADFVLISLKRDWRRRANYDLISEGIRAEFESSLLSLAGNPSNLAEVTSTVSRLLMTIEDLSYVCNCVRFFIKMLSEANDEDLALYCQLIESLKMVPTIHRNHFFSMLLNSFLKSEQGLLHYRENLRLLEAFHRQGLHGPQPFKELVACLEPLESQFNIILFFETLKVVARNIGGERWTTRDLPFWQKEGKRLLAACENGTVQNQELVDDIRAFIKSFKVSKYEKDVTATGEHRKAPMQKAQWKTAFRSNLKILKTKPEQSTKVLANLLADIFDESSLNDRIRTILNKGSNAGDLPRRRAAVVRLMQEVDKLAAVFFAKKPVNKFSSCIGRWLREIKPSTLNNESSIRNFSQTFLLRNDLCRNGIGGAQFQIYIQYIEEVSQISTDKLAMLFIYRVLANVDDLIDNGLWILNYTESEFFKDWSDRVEEFFKKQNDKTSKTVGEIFHFLKLLRSKGGWSRQTGILTAIEGDSVDREIWEKFFRTNMSSLYEDPEHYSQLIATSFATISKEPYFPIYVREIVLKTLNQANSVDKRHPYLSLLAKVGAVVVPLIGRDEFCKEVCYEIKKKLREFKGLTPNSVKQFCETLKLTNEICGLGIDGVDYKIYKRLILLRKLDSFKNAVLVYEILRNVDELIDNGAEVVGDEIDADFWQKWSDDTASFIKDCEGDKSSTEAALIDRFFKELDKKGSWHRNIPPQDEVSLIREEEEQAGEEHLEIEDHSSGGSYEALIQDISLSSEDILANLRGLRRVIDNQPFDVLCQASKAILSQVLPQIVDQPTMKAAVKICSKLRRVNSSCGKSFIDALLVSLSDLLDPSSLKEKENDLHNLEQEIAFTDMPQEQMILADSLQTSRDAFTKITSESPRLVSQLFAKEILSFEFVTAFLEKLLLSQNELVFEGLLDMLGQTGAALIAEVSSRGMNDWWNSYFEKVTSIAHSSDCSERLKFICSEIIAAKLKGFPAVSCDERTAKTLQMMLSELTPELAKVPVKYQTKIDIIRQHMRSCSAEGLSKICDLLLQKLAVLPVEIAGGGQLEPNTSACPAPPLAQEESLADNEGAQSVQEPFSFHICKCEPVVTEIAVSNFTEGINTNHSSKRKSTTPVDASPSKQSASNRRYYIADQKL